MTWLYSYPDTKAKHLESGVDFIINYRSKNIKGIDDIEIFPDSKNEKDWTHKELINLKYDLLLHREADSRRIELKQLIEKFFFGENNRTAGVISSMTKKNVSARTIQSWLISLDKPSSRRCPSWALKALNDYLNEPENKTKLEFITKNRSPQEVSRLENTLDKEEVDLATIEINSEKRTLNTWKEANMNELPELFAKMEIMFRTRINYLEKENSIFKKSLDSSDNFKDYKEVIKKDLSERDAIRSVIDSAKMAIEKEKQEFSSIEGLY